MEKWPVGFALTKAQVKEFRKLTTAEQREYLSVRVHDEAEVWLEYFMTAGVDDRLRDAYLLRPIQK